MDMSRTLKLESHSIGTFPTEVKQSHLLFSCFSSYTIEKSPFQHLFSLNVSCILFLLFYFKFLETKFILLYVLLCCA